MLIMRKDSLHTERRALEAEARAWFDPPDDETLAEIERLDRVFATSSMLDLARPDGLNLALVRSLARLAPAEWDDAHVFAGAALAALQVAADSVDDEAYALRYLAAGRDALRLAELVDAPRAHAKAQTEAASDQKRARGFEKLQDFVTAWRDASPSTKVAAKVAEVGKRLSLSPKRIEALRTEARKLGMLD